MVRILSITAIGLFVSLATTGCHRPGPGERFGKVYYLDGAGNWGWGTGGVTRGLAAAGYTGDVEVFTWSMTLNPLLDQAIPIGARLRASSLAQKIVRYRERYPNNPVNVISLSAGTGPALFAVEGLPDGVKVNNVVLLGASLSSEYDVSKALSRMTGRIYCYYSAHDGILTGVPVIGTIDGKRGVELAGRAGIKAPPGMEDRVVNIGWLPEWSELGWDGGHLDQASDTFVQYQVARHVMDRVPSQPAALRQTRTFPEAALSANGSRSVAPQASSPGASR